MIDTLHFTPCGDRSLLIYVGEGIDPTVNDRVHSLARAIRQTGHPALVEVTASYHAVLVEYDPVRLRLDQLEELTLLAAQGLDAALVEPRTVVLPVCYGGELGPDLGTVAAHAGLPSAEVVARHSGSAYRVYCLGFSPGFPYLGGLDPAIHTPRLAEPRTKVPGGSVGIGGSQTGIYPAPSPGGWQLIGRTPARLFDPYREAPALLEPGAFVRFDPITREEYSRLEAEAEGQVRPEPAEYAPGKTGIRVIQPGMMTTIQDLGRRGYMAYGVSPAGAADFRSLMVGNWLLGNRARTSALEITLAGPEVEFTGPVTFCVTGAPIPAQLIPGDGGSPVTISGWTTHVAYPGDRLRMGMTTAGCRAYLCIAGGLDLTPVLGSLSEDLFGHVGPLGRPLRAGDWLPVGLPLHPPADLAGRSLPADAVPRFGGDVTLRATRGPQDAAFAPEGISAFFGGTYVVGSKSDRQGLRLEGPQIAHAGRPDILSEPVPTGAIQVPAGGQPILLMGNRQTVGGYTKIAVAVYPDVAVAAQLRPGDRVRFQEVDQAGAHAVAWAERRRLAQIRRYLERSMHPAAPPASMSPPTPVAVTSPPVAATPGVRTYRITICGIEFAATVEDIDS